MDQAAIEEQLAESTDESFFIARAIYQEGAHSKSFATVSLSNGLATAAPKGTIVEGASAGGALVMGKTFEDLDVGSAQIRIQCQTSDIQESHVDCQVGANPEPNLNGCKIVCVQAKCFCVHVSPPSMADESYFLSHETV